LTLSELLQSVGLGWLYQIRYKLGGPPGENFGVRRCGSWNAIELGQRRRLDVRSVSMECTPPAPVLGRERARLPGRQRMQQVIVRTYKAKSRPIAVKAFSDEAKTLASQGYSVVLQSWEPGKTGRMFKPAGSLTVTYRLDSAPNVPKPQS